MSLRRDQVPLIRRARRTRARAEATSSISGMLRAHSQLLQDESAERIAAAADTSRVSAALLRQPPGVGLLIAEAGMRRRLLHSALSHRLASVRMAGAPAPALGWALLEQPDLVLIDDRLSTMSGLDAGVLMRSYAPDCRIVLFTDDERSLELARRQAIVTATRDFSWRQVLTAIDEALTA